jgi:hypothetical protein
MDNVLVILIHLIKKAGGSVTIPEDVFKDILADSLKVKARLLLDRDVVNKLIILKLLP